MYRRRVALGFFGCWVAATPAAADITLGIFDGNPHDRIVLTNTGCGVLAGTLVIDLTTSAAGLLIDTEYGGAGTKDPMPVEVERGALRLDPVRDGDRSLTIHVDALHPSETASVTLDLDDERGWWPGPRVEVWGEEIAGTIARFDQGGAQAGAVFDATGQAWLTPAVPPGCSAPAPGPYDTVPSS